MAVNAGQVAVAPEIHLQHIDGAALETIAVEMKSISEWLHGSFLRFGMPLGIQRNETTSRLPRPLTRRVMIEVRVLDQIPIILTFSRKRSVAIMEWGILSSRASARDLAFLATYNARFLAFGSK